MKRNEINKLNANKPLELHESARAAFARRQRILTARENWPVTGWYNDDDFCRAYNTACQQADEIERLRAVLAAAKAFVEHMPPEGIADTVTAWAEYAIYCDKRRELEAALEAAVEAAEGKP